MWKVYILCNAVNIGVAFAVGYPLYRAHGGELATFLKWPGWLALSIIPVFTLAWMITNHKGGRPTDNGGRK